MLQALLEQLYYVIANVFGIILVFPSWLQDGTAPDIMPKFRKGEGGGQSSAAKDGWILIRKSESLPEDFPVRFLLTLNRSELCHKPSLTAREDQNMSF